MHVSQAVIKRKDRKMDRLESDLALIAMVLAGADFWKAYQYFVPREKEEKDG